MGAIRTIVIAGSVSFLVVALCYTIARAIGSWHHGYPWADMDWDNDGSTSIAEFVRASDIGVRKVEHGGQCRQVVHAATTNPDQFGLPFDR